MKLRNGTLGVDQGTCQSYRSQCHQPTWRWQLVCRCAVGGVACRRRSARLRLSPPQSTLELRFVWLAHAIGSRESSRSPAKAALRSLAYRAQCELL